MWGALCSPSPAVREGEVTLRLTSRGVNSSALVLMDSNVLVQVPDHGPEQEAAAAAGV